MGLKNPDTMGEIIKQEQKEKSFYDSGFNETYDLYEVQSSNGKETIFGITSKMASENILNENKTLFRNIILQYAEKDGFFPILQKGNKIEFNIGDDNHIELIINGQTYNINFFDKTVIKINNK